MAEEPRRRGLGRGLSALLGEPLAEMVKDAAAAEAQDLGGPETAALKGLRLAPIEKLRPGRFQPRRHFDQAAIDDLVESVREKGILQPILVRPDPENDDFFEIIAGERRWRAAQAASLHEVPVIIRALTDREALEVALVENLQRQDLSPLDEAEGYRRLLDDFAHTQDQLSKAVGKSRSHVANMMRLLNLPEEVKQMLDGGELTAGHARALLTSSDPLTLAKMVVAKGLSVRKTESLAQKKGVAKGKVKEASSVKDADLLALERDLSSRLGLKVAISHHGQGGTVAIQYMTLEQLDDILQRLSFSGREVAVEAELSIQPVEEVPFFGLDEE
ncbi:MAG TPA: ParB/RepB/Spo0J family partition protein [Rhodospirillaceae bacterium]|nr:ParB/RepB/Spo0J family partition protein [Rhodospirillaceae bacterium]